MEPELSWMKQPKEGGQAAAAQEPLCSQQPAEQVAPNKSASPLDRGSGWINCAISMTFCCSLNILITVHPRNSFFLPHKGGKNIHLNFLDYVTGLQTVVNFIIWDMD